MRLLLRTALPAVLLLAWAPLGFTRDSCKEALAAEGGSLGEGFTYSLYFMLTVVLFVVPAVFGLLLWNSFRSNRVRTRKGAGYAPPAGVERWVDEPGQGSGDA